MAVSATRVTAVRFSGDVTLDQSLAAASNASSPGMVQLVNLASGFNSISVPSGATAATLVPPSGNTQSLVLKGITGDTGLRIHNTDPTSLSLNSATTTIGITAGGTVTGLRIFWS